MFSKPPRLLDVAGPSRRALSGAALAAAAAVLAVAAAPPATAASAGADGLVEAIREGRADFSVRYRFEGVDQDGFEHQASASTALARLSWSSAAWSGFSIGVETDYVGVVGADEFNSTVNGKTEYPLVADPEGLDLNQAYLRYRSGGFTATAGRQRILHGRQRILGGVAWRQNEQTYDALRLQSTVGPISLDYSYIGNVNRIFGPEDGAQPADWKSDIHALVGGWTLGGHSVSAFGYEIDLKNDNGPANSNSTIGAEYSGRFGRLTLNAGIASQSAFGGNPVDYDAPYQWIEGVAALGGLTLTLGHEVLGSDGGAAGFRMPVATLHKFNGWADRFLATPPAGLEDTYLTAATRLGRISVAGTWHAFAAHEDGADYGTEFDGVATLAVSDALSVQFKFATYDSDGYATDTSKWWFTVNFTP